MLGLRLAAVCLMAARLVAADQRISWAIGAWPALAVGLPGAIAIATEPRPWLRRTMFGVIAGAYAVWMLRDDAWRIEAFWLGHAMAVIIEAVIASVFLETRAWRWSLAPGLVFGAAVLYFAFPTVSADVATRHASWLVQLVLFLCANAARRAMAAERRPSRSAPPGSFRSVR